ANNGGGISRGCCGCYNGGIWLDRRGRVNTRASHGALPHNAKARAKEGGVQRVTSGRRSIALHHIRGGGLRRRGAEVSHLYDRRGDALGGTREALADFIR